MPNEAAAQATTETPKPDALAKATSAETIRAELDKVQGQGLGGARGALELASQGVVLRNLDDAWRFATIIGSTGLAPKDLNTPAKILLAMQLGMEVGLPPMASIQNIAVINGRPSLWGDVCLGLCRRSGLFDEEAFEQVWQYDAEGNAVKAICTVRRLPNGKKIVSEFTWAEAVKAKLDTKDTYKSYRKRMLMNRARAFALRDGFADVLKGVLIAEEAADLPERNITPAPATAAPVTSLDELTEQLNASAAAAEQQATAEQPEQAEQTAAEELAEAAAEQPTQAGEEDPLPAIKLGDCKYVTDVEAVRKVWAAPTSKLSALQKKEIHAACDARSAEIRAAIRSAKKQPKGQQDSLLG